MTSNGKINLDKNDLICPITYQIFSDPVIAADGYTYERAAIIRWIEEHGTSPFTRQPLNINQLQRDDYLKKLAIQRQISSTSSIDYTNFQRQTSSISSIDYTNFQRETPIISNHFNIYFDQPIFNQSYEISLNNIPSIDNNENPVYQRSKYLIYVIVVPIFIILIFFLRYIFEKLIS